MPPSERTCRKCGETKALDLFTNAPRCRWGKSWVCKGCIAVRTREWEKQRPGRKWDRNIRTYYGVDEVWYLAKLKEQTYGCAICTMTCKTGRRLCVDHDHKTGTVRGLLCSACNSGIGHLKDSPTLLRAAMEYLGRNGKALP